MDSSLKYADMTDKAYGLAGMAIALMAWDAEDWLDGIDLDAAPEEAIRMTADYYVIFAPKTAAKVVWEQSLKRFQVAAAMTVANVLCREMVLKGHSIITSDSDSALRKFMEEEGDTLCGLERDESEKTYNATLGYCRRLFTYDGVCRLAEQLANYLQERRSVTANEVFELLLPLTRM